MRRFWGSALGTTATIAVILVALSFVGAGAFASATTNGVRTAAGLGSGASVTHAAAPAAVPAPKVLVHPAMHAAGGNNSSNSTNATYTNITWVQLTPQNTTIAPGGNVALTVVVLCTNATLTNYTCPAGVTYAWSQAGAI